MKHLIDIKSRYTLFKRVRLISLAAVVTLGSYAAFIPKAALAADCAAIGTPTGTAQTTVTVPANGTYRIWTKLATSDASANALLVSIDDQCRKLGGTPLNSGVWTWVGHQDGNVNAKATLDLTAGQHSVTLTGIAAGIKVNKLMLLANTDCTPLADGTNCTPPPAPNDTESPTVPTGLKASVTSAKALSLSWAASTDNTAVASYDVYRGTGSATPAKIASVNEPLFNDYNLVPSTSYSYFVVANDTSGNQSAHSASLLAKTLAQTPAGKGKLYGKVTFSKSNAPVAAVSFASNGAVQSYPTDDNGYYYITDIPAGTYMMKFQAGASVKYSEVKIKASADTVKDMSLPKVTAPQAPPVPQPFAVVALGSASLANGATFVTEPDETTSVLLGQAAAPDPDPTPDPIPTTGCITAPSACGYPDITNTGYKPTGVTLTTDGVTINQDGDFVITEPGIVIDSKQIDGCVIVKAPNVTIKRSLITNCLSYFNIRLYPGSSNFTLEDTEINGNNVDGQNAAIVDDGSGPVTIRRMYMHNVSDGPHPGEHWLIEDSYITDLYACAICHNDTIQSAGAIDVTLRHNTIVNTPEDNPSGEGGKNAVVRIATEQGSVNGFVIDNNLLSGGNYAVQVREQGNGYPQGVVIKNNRIVPNWRFGAYDFGSEYTQGVVQLLGNYRDDTSDMLNTY